MALLVYYQNVTGLRSKTREFKINTTNYNADIYFLTETNLNDSVLSSEFFDASIYTVFRRDRQTTACRKVEGGGALIAVRKEFSAIQQVTWQSDAEDVWVTLHAGNGNRRLHLCCVYLPPEDDYARVCFTNKLQSIWCQLNGETSLICGDFNIPKITWKPNDSILIPTFPDDKYVDLLDSFSFNELQQANSILNFNNRLLDLVWYKNASVSNLRQSDLPLGHVSAHHPPLEFSFDCGRIKLLPFKPIDTYNFRKCNYNNLINFYQGFNWSDILSDEFSVDANVGKFYETLSAGISQFTPKFKSKHKNFPFYFSARTRQCIQDKNKYHKKWKLFSNVNDYSRFSELRRKSKNLMNYDYLRYVSSCENNIKSDPKNFWKFVSSSRRDSGIPSAISYNEQTAVNPNDVSQLFATYFKSVYEPYTQIPFGTPLSVNNLNVFSIVLTEDDVLRKLKGLNPNKGAGSDGIPSCFAKNCAEGLCKPLFAIFKQSLNSGTFPQLWKTSYLSPIFKNSGDKSSVNNYRGISKLCVFSKVLESLIYDQLFIYFKSLIIPQQHGFFSKRSIETNLIIYSQFISGVMDNRGQVDSLYTDFSKAFDKLDHNILVSKLAELGVQGDLLRWFSSYLFGRKQRVKINEYLSESFSVTSGVPQGSHLGPLLFLLYINSISTCFLYAQFLLYADDLKIYARVKSLEDCELLQGDLERVSRYCKENKLFLNLSKCSCISFTKNYDSFTYNYSVNNEPLNRVNQIKDLGVIFDHKLTFNQHIDYVVRKCNKMLGFVSRICSDFKNVNAIKSVYFAFIYSRLNFACVVWNPFYHKYILRIESVQNKFARFLNWRINGIYEVESISATKQLFNLTPLEVRRKKSELIFLFKLLHDMYDAPSLLSLLALHVPARSTRQRCMFNIEHSNTNLGINSPITRLSLRFNTYCQDMDLFARNLTVVCFKRLLNLRVVQ